MKLSVVIPAHDEAGSIVGTVTGIAETLGAHEIDYEVLVVDDASTDGTGRLVEELGARNPRIRCVRSPNPPGFGFAVRAGLDRFAGDAVVIAMADTSDDPNDIVAYHHILESRADCAFGSRFVRGARVHDYPKVKLALNRIVNTGIRVLFRLRYNDTTNAFKGYRREVIETAQPLFANHFNLTVELPLKAIARGHSFDVVPVSWTNRTTGTSKLHIQEMGSRYLFIILYVFLERHLSRGDYKRAASGDLPADAGSSR